MKKQDKLILIAIIGVICYYALQAIIFAVIWFTLKH